MPEEIQVCEIHLRFLSVYNKDKIEDLSLDPSLSLEVPNLGNNEENLSFVLEANSLEEGWVPEQWAQHFQNSVWSWQVLFSHCTCYQDIFGFTPPFRFLLQWSVTCLKWLLSNFLLRCFPQYYSFPLRLEFNFVNGLSFLFLLMRALVVISSITLSVHICAPFIHVTHLLTTLLTSIISFIYI